MAISGFPIKAQVSGDFIGDVPWFDTARSPFNPVFNVSNKCEFNVNTVKNFKVGQTVDGIFAAMKAQEFYTLNFMTGTDGQRLHFDFSSGEKYLYYTGGFLQEIQDRYIKLYGRERISLEMKKVDDRQITD